MAVTPYVVGQWVRGEKFYGREALLEEILDGNRNCLWLLGTRRVGKTSILKQLEHLTSSATSPTYFPLFWDFQGSEEVDDLHEGFRDALADAADRLEELGLDYDEVDDPDLFSSMSRLRRELKARNLKLLLLGDEAEELVPIHQKAPRFLRRLRRALQSHENVRTVLASTIRLWHLAGEQSTTSPFLHGFMPPLAIRGLEDEAARALIGQLQLDPGSRPSFDPRSVQIIQERCNNHPYLLQLLSERALELGDLDRSIEEIAADEMVSFFFGADLGMLGEAERAILQVIDDREVASTQVIEQKLALQSSSLQGSLQRLEVLGFVARTATGEYSLVNYFFRRWFGELSKNDHGQGAGRHAGVRASPLAPTEPLKAAVEAAETRMIDKRYALMARLGSGSSGEVYKARDTMLQTVVAIKLLRPEYSSDEASVERLRREVVLARDISHPNVLKIYHLGDDGESPYVTMQYVAGADLAHLLSNEAPLSLERTLMLGTRLVGAVGALHACGILHRDIKPSNVLIDEDGEPRLTDFGLARLQKGPAVTMKGLFLGTPAYASPEQASGDVLDERSDVYALGVVLFEMVTGKLPFAGDSARDLLIMHLSTPPPRPSEVLPTVPQSISDLILRCLTKDRSHRIQSASDLLAGLEAVGRQHAGALQGHGAGRSAPFPGS